MENQFITGLEVLNYKKLKGIKMITVFRSILHLEVKYHNKNRRL